MTDLSLVIERAVSAILAKHLVARFISESDAEGIVLAIDNLVESSIEVLPSGVQTDATAVLLSDLIVDLRERLGEVLFQALNAPPAA